MIECFIQIGFNQIDQGRFLETIESIKNQVSLLLCYVNDLLDHRQIQEGVFNPKLKIFDPNKAFDMVINMLSQQANAQKVGLYWLSRPQFSPFEPLPAQDENNCERLPILIGDEVRLKQILINLTKNALKFTKYGKVVLTADYNEID